uniref:holo-[acyl-carrier-protein] synthase n=1 Tax=Salix viminalis TaxID=40686 RepID=A0A6N2M065_SALVM
MRGDQLQKRALLARALVRTTIARYQINNHVVDPRSLKFRKNVHGKPELVWESDDGQCSSPLHFNISHTSSLIACGVTVNSPEAYAKALGRGFSAAPFKTFTIRLKDATNSG